MTRQPLDTPVLFIIFNRPDTTAVVFERIREARPRRLFISADGSRPNREGERERCEQARAIVQKVDWECEVETKFSETNLGCRLAVSSAIDWFFSRVTEGIILEDDCVPDASFFTFCASMLEYYRDDERVMHVAGTNTQDGVMRGSASYFFSTNSHIWGWATWRRAWQKYDVNIASFPEFVASGAVADAFPRRRMRQYWIRRFNLIVRKIWNTWDIQWQYALTTNNGLAVSPNENLISNIGFDLNATHTQDDFDTLAGRPVKPITAITHPPFMIADFEADWYTFRKYTSPPKVKKLWKLIRRKL